MFLFDWFSEVTISTNFKAKELKLKIDFGINDVESKSNIFLGRIKLHLNI